MTQRIPQNLFMEACVYGLGSLAIAGVVGAGCLALWVYEALK